MPVTLTHAMVLAAGLGKRMRPLTDATPKPLLPVAGRSLLMRALDRVVEAGIENAVVNTHYLADQVDAHLEGRDDLAITLSDERGALLETGGGVAKALGALGDGPFLVANSDALWLNANTSAIGRLAERWDDGEMDALLLLQSTVEAYGYDGMGDFDADAVGLLERRQPGCITPYLFAGVQILHPRLFADAPEGAFSLNVLFDRALAAGRLYGVVHDGEWFHVGTPEGLAQAEAYMAESFPGIRHRGSTVA